MSLLRGGAPALRIGLAAAVALATVAVMVAIEIDRPWLGARLAWDAKAGSAVTITSVGPAAGMPRGTRVAAVSGGGDRLALTQPDLVVEPDGALGSYADYERFLARHERLMAIQASPQVTFHTADGRAFAVTPQHPRPITSLPPDFWVQIVVGVAAWMIAAGVWAFKPQEAIARYLLLSGLATLIFSPFAAGYTTRELSMPVEPFRHLNDLNFLGGSLFAASLVGLLLYYPRKIAPRWVGVAIVAVFVVWYQAQQMGVFESMTMARRVLVMVAICLTFALAAVQWGFTRRDPVARASLGWFLMSWVTGITLFGLGILLPQLFGVDTSWLQPYSFLVFLLVYLGLAFGILRYRLFDLGVWWGRVMIWALGLLALALFDLAFVAVLGISAERSLSLALLACGLLWFPMRSWLWGRLTQRRTGEGRAQFEQIVATAFGRTPQERDAGWRRLLDEAFAPLNLRPEQAAGARAALDADGQSLVVPAVDDLPALRLEYAAGGRRLFNRADVRRADELAGMLRHVIESRDAYERGVRVERKRIASDIHDNLGATLLSALHSDDRGRKDRYIRETLADLRSIVSEPVTREPDLAAALADARRETAERLEALGIQLSWQVEIEGAPSAATGLAQTLRAILRETINNVVKHAGAERVAVNLIGDGSAVVLAVEDDGRGFEPAEVTEGAGLGGMRDRAARHGGTVVWAAGPGGQGTRVVVRLES